MSYRDAQFERKPHGAFIVEGREIAHTLRCAHGGEHFVSVRGSGMRRGFCTRCIGVTCGDPAHDACIPWEARLEHMEGRKTKYTDLIIDNGGL